MKKLLNISNFILFFLLIFSFNFFITNFVVAATDNTIATMDDYINPVGKRVFGDSSNVSDKRLEVVVQNVVGAIANDVVKQVLSVVGILVLVLFLYAGIQYILAAGNSDAVKKANKTMKYSVIGIIVVFTSYIIINFIFAVLNRLK